MKAEDNKKLFESFYLQVCSCLYDCQDLNLLVQNFSKILKLYESNSFKERQKQEHDKVEFLMACNFKIMLIVRLLALFDGYKNNKTYSLSFLVEKSCNGNSIIKQSYEELCRKHKKLLSNMRVMRDKVFAHNEALSENCHAKESVNMASSDIANEELDSLIEDIVYALRIISKEYSLADGTFIDSAYEVPFNNWFKYHYSI